MIPKPIILKGYQQQNVAWNAALLVCSHVAVRCSQDSACNDGPGSTPTYHDDPTLMCHDDPTPRCRADPPATDNGGFGTPTCTNDPAPTYNNGAGTTTKTRPKHRNGLEPQERCPSHERRGPSRRQGKASLGPLGPDSSLTESHLPGLVAGGGLGHCRKRGRARVYQWRSPSDAVWRATRCAF